MVYYPFNTGSGTTALDQSGAGVPMNLELSGAASWLPGGQGIAFSGGRVGTTNPATKLITQLQSTSQSTFEVWIRPANLTQTGPAALLAVDDVAGASSVQIGQRTNDFRTELLNTGKNGSDARPWLWNANVVTTQTQHLVHTYDGTTERVYLDGVLQPNTVVRTGVFSNWGSDHLLSIGNTAASDRFYTGEVHLVAVYNRALSEADVQLNFAAGSTP